VQLYENNLNIPDSSNRNFTYSKKKKKKICQGSFEALNLADSSNPFFKSTSNELIHRKYLATYICKLPDRIQLGAS
jgi:hypothetical protein